MRKFFCAAFAVCILMLLCGSAWAQLVSPQPLSRAYTDTEVATAQQAAIDNATAQVAALNNDTIARTNVDNNFSVAQTFSEINATDLNADCIVRTDETITVCAEGCDHTTVEAAFAAVNSLIILNSAVVTIDIQAGTYTPAANAVQLLSPFSGSIVISGATPYDTDGADGVQTITGTTGAETVTFNMTSTGWQSEVAVNDYVSIKAEDGVSNADAQVSGFWRVTAVDTENNRLTVQTRHRLDISAIVNGGTFPATIGYTIKKPLSIIAVNYSTSTDLAIYMSRSPLSISNLALVNTGRGAGDGINIAGSGSTTVSNCYIAGFGGSSATGSNYGLLVGPQQYILLQSSAISDCRYGVFVRGGTLYAGQALISGCHEGGVADLNGLLYAAFSSASQGNTTGAFANLGGTIINGHMSGVLYNVTGASVTDFSKYGNPTGTHANNTTPYAQTANTLLADGSYISDPE